MSDDEKLIRRLRQTLDRQAVDDGVRSELQRARRAALEAAPRRARTSWWPAAVAAGLLIGAATALLYPQLAPEQVPDAAFEDLAVIDGEDELELLEELEFYVWLEQQEQG